MLLINQTLTQAKLGHGHKYHIMAQTESTNSVALAYGERLASVSDCLPIWFTAQSQTKGRGTGGRCWVSDSLGNLYTSFLFQPNCKPSSLSQLSILAGVALYETISLYLDKNSEKKLWLKWPNDLMIGRAKLSGILVETCYNQVSDQQLAVIGIGVNVCDAPIVEAQETIALANLGVSSQPSYVQEQLAPHIEHWLKLWNNDRFFVIIAKAWIIRAGLMNHQITITSLDAKSLTGCCQGVDDYGRLKIKTFQGVMVALDFATIKTITKQDSDIIV